MRALKRGRRISKVVQSKAVKRELQCESVTAKTRNLRSELRERPENDAAGSLDLYNLHC